MSTSTVPSSYVELGIQTLNQVESRWHYTAQDEGLVFGPQLQYTKGVLESVPEEHLVEHGNVHRELYRVIVATKALLDSSTDWSITTHECFMENLFDLQWWTCVVALQVGKGQLLDPQTYLSLQVQLEELVATQLLKKEPPAGVTISARCESPRRRHLPSYQLQALLIQREGSFTRRLMFPWDEPVPKDVEVDVDPAVVENLNSISSNSFPSVPPFGGELSGIGRDPMEVLNSANVHSIAEDHEPESLAPVNDVSQGTFSKTYLDNSAWQEVSCPTSPDRDRLRVGKRPAAATSSILGHVNLESSNMSYEAHLPDPKRRKVSEVSDVSQGTFSKTYPDNSAWQEVSCPTSPDRDRLRVGKRPAAATSSILGHVNLESSNMSYEAHLPDPKRRKVSEMSDVSQGTFSKTYPDNSAWQEVSCPTSPDRDRLRVGKRPAAATSSILGHVNLESSNMSYEAHLPDPKRRKVSEDGIKLVRDEKWELELDMVLTEIRNKDDRVSHVGVFDVVGPVDIILAKQNGSSTEEHITIDLFQDMLGVSDKGWVIQTLHLGKLCAMKRLEISTTELNDGTNVKPPDLTRLWHPHIVNLLDYWTEKSYLFLVMELMDGDLAELIANKSRTGLDKTKSLFSLAEAVDILLQIAKGMVYMHDMGVAHPHLKCASVLLKADTTRNPNQIDHYYVVKLGGFGNSMKCDPEDRSRDVYLFGLICLDILTGNVQSEDSIQHHIPERTPPTMRFCIEKCLSAALTFSEVVILLLLTQLQMLEGKEDEEIHRNKSLAESNISLGGCAVNYSSPGTSEEISTFRSHHVHQLYPEVGDPDPVSSKAGVTFILFHGFPKGSEEWKTTWMTRDSKDIWPQTWLPQDLGGMNVRVLSVSYNDIDPIEEMADHLGKDLVKSLVFSSPGNATDTHHSVVLVGHGYGGLVIKNLIFQTYNHVGEEDDIKQRDKEWQKAYNFLQKLRGIVFFSVPHSTVEGTREFEHYIMESSKSRVLRRSGLLKWLKNDMEAFSQQMKQLSVDFEARVPKRTVILSFVEGKGKKVQISGNSKLRPIRWISEQIEEDNHFEICRPHSKEHVGYKKLLVCLKKNMIPLTKKLYMQKCDDLEEFLSMVWTLVALEELNFGGCKSLMRISEGLGYLMSLKKLSMQECDYLEEFPSGVGTLVTLEELNFSACKSLKKIPERFGGLRSLKKLLMQECYALKEFPFGMNTLVALEELNFSGCRSLKRIPEGLGGLRALKKLHMQECYALEEFPSGMYTLEALEELNFSGCKSLKWIPEGLGGLRALKKLHMQECYALEEFPSGMDTLVALEELNFSRCASLKRIPEGLRGLRALKTLSMGGCYALEEFPSGMYTLVALEKLNFSRCRFLRFPKGLRGLRALKRLHMQECYALEEFPSGMYTLEALEELNFSRCRSLKRIPEGLGGLRALKKLHMQECYALEEFPSGMDTLVALEELNFSRCTSLKRIPEGLGGLKALKELHMQECYALEEFPSGMNMLVALEELVFNECKSSTRFPEGLGGLRALKRLHMQKCYALEEFPSGMYTLEALEELNFSRCRSLKRIPEGLGGLRALKKLHMQKCYALEEFPSGMDTLVALEELNFSRCVSLKRIPEGLGGLKALKELHMQECYALEEFPSGMNMLVALEELVFNECKSSTRFPEGLGGLRALKRLHMQKCYTLEEFPSGMYMLEALEELNFNECKSLTRFPEGLGGLRALKKLHMQECYALEEFPSGMDTLVALEELNFSRCVSLKRIPEGLGGLKALKRLHMQECYALEEFPSGMYMLEALEELVFNECKSLTRFPEGLGGLRALKKLHMQECYALEEFPSGMDTLVALEELNFSRCVSLKRIPEGLGGLKALKELHMQECYALEEFPSGMNMLVALEELVFNECKSSTRFPEGLGGLRALKKLHMQKCYALEEFPSGMYMLEALEELNFNECKSLTRFPEGLGGLRALKKLHMQECYALEEFPSGMDTLVALEELNFSRCVSLKRIPEGLGGLRALKELHMQECYALEEFPSGMNTLVALEELNFSGCKSLTRISEGLGGLRALKKLHMQKCDALEVFPSGLDTLVALEELICNGCKSLKLIPEEVWNLRGLKKLYMGDSYALEEFPSVLDTLVDFEELNSSEYKSLTEILDENQVDTNS